LKNVSEPASEHCLEIEKVGQKERGPDVLYHFKKEDYSNRDNGISSKELNQEWRDDVFDNVALGILAAEPVEREMIAIADLTGGSSITPS
jgi:hypothetical protein